MKSRGLAAAKHQKESKRTGCPKAETVTFTFVVPGDQDGSRDERGNAKPAISKGGGSVQGNPGAWNFCLGGHKKRRRVDKCEKRSVLRELRNTS